MIVMTTLALPLVMFLPNYAASQDGNYFAVVNGGLLRGLVGFAVGVSSFVVFQKFILIRCPGWLSMILTAVLASLFFVAESSPLSSILFVYIVLFFLMIALAMSEVRSRVTVTALTFFGAISYSIYLIHIPVYLLMEHMLGDATVRGAGKAWVLLVILILAPASAYLFEKPVQRRIVQYFSRT